MNDPSDATIFKILPASEWEAAIEKGTFSGSGIDLQDGFIHLSRRPQVKRTASLYFSGISGLALLTVNSGALGGNLKWEASRDGDLFPHVYGNIPVTAVARVDPLPLNEQGEHIFPDDI